MNDGGTHVIEADRYLVATGSAPWVPPIEGLTGAAITSVRGEAAARSVSIKTAAGGERELGYGEILVAAGRRPVTAGLNLEAAGVKTGARGEIVTDEFQGIGNPRINR